MVRRFCVTRRFDIANHFCEYAGFDFDVERWYPGGAAQAEWLTAYVRAAAALELEGSAGGGGGGGGGPCSALLAALDGSEEGRSLRSRSAPSH